MLTPGLRQGAPTGEIRDRHPTMLVYMPRQPARVEVLPLEPPKYMDVWKTQASPPVRDLFGARHSKAMGQYDVVSSCNIGGDSQYFIKHRDSEDVRRNAKKLAKDAAHDSTVQPTTFWSALIRSFLLASCGQFDSQHYYNAPTTSITGTGRLKGLGSVKDMKHVTCDILRL
jgi:hypothetical protein